MEAEKPSLKTPVEKSQKRKQRPNQDEEEVSSVVHLSTLKQDSHSDWKTWKNGKAFSSQGKV